MPKRGISTGDVLPDGVSYVRHVPTAPYQANWQDAERNQRTKWSRSKGLAFVGSSDKDRTCSGLRTAIGALNRERVQG